MTTQKTIALTRQTFVGKVMSQLSNMLSRLVITFLPRSKHILISSITMATITWLQSPSEKAPGSLALQKRISTKTESSKACKVFIWRKKSIVRVDRHTGSLRGRVPELLSCALMVAWITFMGCFFQVSFGQSFWAAWFTVCICYISGSSHVCICIS